MNRSLITKVLITTLILLAAITPFSLGCEQEEEERMPPGPYPSELSETTVPNVPIDIYLYAKQDDPTVIPAELTNAAIDVNVESFALWGVALEEDFAFGAALTLTTTREASQVYSQIKLEKDSWKKLSSNVIYLVYGLGPAADSLKQAISEDDFKSYDDNEAIQSVGFLPDAGETKLAAVAVAQPSGELIKILMADVDDQQQDLINFILDLINLKIICGGLYSPDQIDVEETVNLIDSGASLSETDTGLLLMVRSGIPNLLLQPAVGKILTEQQFTQINSGELVLYKGSLDTDNGGVVHLMVRVENSDLLIAASGQENYAETLINSVILE